MNSFENGLEDGVLPRRWAVSGLALIVAVFYVTAAAHFSYTPDDAYIYQQYGRNLAHGGGYAFNAGEPTYGVTAPLWVFVIAGEHLFPIDAVMGTKAFDLFAASLALVMFFLTAHEILRHRLAALLATLVFSMNLTMLRWASSGVEISFAVFLILTTVWYSLRNEYYVGAIFAGLAALVRPEAGLIIIPMLIDIAVNSVDQKHALRIALGVIAVCAVITIPWCIYALHSFGSVLPAAMIVKGGIIPRWADVVFAVGSGARTIGASDGLCIVLLAAGIVSAATGRSRRDLGQSSEPSLILLPLSWIVVSLLVYGCAGGDIAPRSLLLVLPFITIGGFWGGMKLQEKFGVIRRLGYNLAVLIAAVLLIQNQIVYYHYVKPFMQNYAQGSDDALLSIGSWCAEHTPSDAIIAAADVGTIGYSSGRKICDLGGVVTPEMRPIVRAGIPYDDIAMRKLYLGPCVPDYIVDRAPVADRLTDAELLPLFHRVFFGLTVTNRHAVYYTLYQIRHDVQQQTLAGKGTSTQHGY